MKKISYDHPHYKEIQNKVEDRFGRDFNQINHDVVKKCLDDCDFEYILDPSFMVRAQHYLNCYGDEENIRKEYKKNKINISFEEWLEEKYDDEIQESWSESENYPMWSTLFEAKDSCMSDWIEEHVDELYGVGIGVMGGGDYFNNMLFIAGAGYNFYEAHWIPLYVNLLEWVKEEVIA